MSRPVARRARFLAGVITFAPLLGASAATAQWGPPPQVGPNASTPPALLREVGFDQKIGQSVPLDLELRDETGKTVRLGEFFHGKPVVLALVYYECPMLCTLVLNGAVAGLKPLDLRAGTDFEFVAVSFNPRDTALLAAAKKANYVDRYRRPSEPRSGTGAAGEGWHFLTGEPAAIERLTGAVGFRYVWDKDSKQYAHPSGIVVLTPGGQLSRYLFGVEYEPRDLKLALVESSAGRLGSVSDRVLLYCFHYDPTNGKYSATVLNLVRAGGALTVLSLGLFLGLAWQRERARSRRVGTEDGL